MTHFPKKIPIFNGSDLQRARLTGMSARRVRRTKSKGPKGLQLEVGARKAPRLLVIYVHILEDRCPHSIKKNIKYQFNKYKLIKAIYHLSINIYPANSCNSSIA